jgi:hypothetical protein
MALLSRSALALVLTLALAACASTSDTDDTMGSLAPQASGSFSGGSLRRGSVIGVFVGAGIGNKVHEVTMTVVGEQWFECRNNGGNLAPGQFAFVDEVTEGLDLENVDSNGRFEVTNTVEAPEPTDDDCKRNWTVNRYAGLDPDPETGQVPAITFLRVHSVKADLTEILDDGTEVRDTLEWKCDDPEPADPLIDYEAPPLTGPDGVCTLVDGPR